MAAASYRRVPNARRRHPAGQTSRHRLGPVRASVDYWTWYSRLVRHLVDARARARRRSPPPRRNRFDALVQFARERSPFYRDAYRGLPAGRLDPAALPVVTKRALMDRFDDWVTDPAVDLAGVDRVPRRSGAHRRALPRPLCDLEELGQHRRAGDLRAGWRCAGDVRRADGRASRSRALRRRPRLAHRGARRAGRADRRDRRSLRQHRVVAARSCRNSPWIAARGFSILDPLPQLVAELNAYRPAFVASYPTMLVAAGRRAESRRLEIDPVSLWSGGECLPAGARARRSRRAFGCPVVNEYGASECMSIAFGCDEGWLHVNADWVLLEPVDDDVSPDAARRAFADGAAHQPRQPRAADHPLRPRRQRHRQPRSRARAGARCRRSRSRAGTTTCCRWPRPTGASCGCCRSRSRPSSRTPRTCFAFPDRADGRRTGCSCASRPVSRPTGRPPGARWRRPCARYLDRQSLPNVRVGLDRDDRAPTGAVEK